MKMPLGSFDATTFAPFISVGGTGGNVSGFGGTSSSNISDVVWQNYPGTMANYLNAASVLASADQD